MRQAARLNEQAEGERSAALRWAMQGFLLVVLLALLGWAGWTVWNPQSFPLRTVRLVTPVEHVSREELQRTVVPFAQAGFVRIDMEGLRTRLEALPWVHHVALKRVWPDVIEVGVVEQVPVAYWQRGGLVNADGDVFAPEGPVEAMALPVFDGPEGTGRQLVEHHRQLAQMVAGLGLQLRKVELSERRAWSVETDNGLLLSLGRAEPYARMERFVKSYAQVIAPRVAEVERIDLRYTNGFAIRWRAGVLPAA